MSSTLPSERLRRKEASPPEVVDDAFERDGDPRSVIESRFKRKAQVYVGLGLTSAGLYAASEAMYLRGEYYEARWKGRGIQHMYGPGRRKALKWNARAGTSFMAAKRVGRVATRGIPVLGTVMLAYDVYTVADWAFAKGKLPAGAKRRD